MPQGHFLPEGTRLNTPENRAVSTRAAMEKAAEEQRILEGVVTMCDASHNLIVDFNGMTGLIPRSEAAMGVESGETKEIAVLSRVGKPVCFQIIGEGAGQYLFSRARVQQRALHYFLQHLAPGDVVQARVTHLEPFGAFVDVGCGVTSLIGIEHISVSRISHPAERFAVGQMVYAAVGSVDPIRARISLTHRELLGTWLENASRFAPGETVSGIVRGNEDYGIFVELAPNLSGLAERERGHPRWRRGIGLHQIHHSRQDESQAHRHRYLRAGPLGPDSPGRLPDHRRPSGTLAVFAAGQKRQDHGDLVRRAKLTSPCTKAGKRSPPLCCLFSSGAGCGIPFKRTTTVQRDALSQITVSFADR